MPCVPRAASLAFAETPADYTLLEVGLGGRLDATNVVDPSLVIITAIGLDHAAGGGHHGGAWKVAYADFVTAMMAFFMMMWLLNATTEQQRQGLADYFSPTVPINRVSGGGDGAFGEGDRFRAQHLGELADMVGEGHRAVMLFLVQRADATRLTLARDIDPVYGEAFDMAHAAGVEALLSVAGAGVCGEREDRVCVAGTAELAGRAVPVQHRHLTVHQHEVERVVAEDGQRLFAWTDPPLPTGWHGMRAAQADRAHYATATTVSLHR